MLVSGVLPDSTALPAEGELSVPAGAQLQWIGEILGKDPSADPELKYVKSAGGGVDIYRFTLTKSRVAQVEVSAAGAVVPKGTGSDVSVAWVPSRDVPEVRMSVSLPSGAQIVREAEGAAVAPGGAGGYYAKIVKSPKAGEALRLSFAYSVPAPPSAPGGAASGTDGTVATVVILLIFVVGATIAAVAIRRKMAPSRAGEGAARTAQAGRKGPRDSAEGASEGSARSGGSSMSGSAKRKLIIGGVVAVMAAVALIVGTQAAKPQMVGDTISQTFSQGDPCQTITIPLTIPQGADPAKTAETVFSALKRVQGLNNATYNRKTASLQVGFCESKSSEQVIRQALAPTGFVSASESTTMGAPATSPGGNPAGQ
jgi:hypothetical protein